MRSACTGSISIVLASAFLSACATPTEVRDLADKTAANVGMLGAQIDQLAQESRTLADLRAANVAQLHAANARIRANYKYDLELTRKGGGAANLTLVDQIEDWGKQAAEIFKAAENAHVERKTAILAAQKKLDTKSQALSQIAQSLATLANEESATDRVRFLIGFAKDLKGEVKMQLEQGDKSSASAKKLLDNIKNEARERF